MRPWFGFLKRVVRISSREHWRFGRYPSGLPRARHSKDVVQQRVQGERHTVSLVGLSCQFGTMDRCAQLGAEPGFVD